MLAGGTRAAGKSAPVGFIARAAPLRKTAGKLPSWTKLPTVHGARHDRRNAFAVQQIQFMPAGEPVFHEKYFEVGDEVSSSQAGRDQAAHDGPSRNRGSSKAARQGSSHQPHRAGLSAHAVRNAGCAVIWRTLEKFVAASRESAENFPEWNKFDESSASARRGHHGPLNAVHMIHFSGGSDGRGNRVALDEFVGAAIANPVARRRAPLKPFLARLGFKQARRPKVPTGNPRRHA